MKTLYEPTVTQRYEIVTEEKAGGATYTPKILADFVANQIVNLTGKLTTKRTLRILDPGAGNGELLISLLQKLSVHPHLKIQVYGFETDPKALNLATVRIKQQFPDASVHFELENFLEFVLNHFGEGDTGSLFRSSLPEAYDLIIANPPYVRTQIMGASRAQLLARQFGLSGRVDLYYAFILAMAQVLKPQGIAGIIVSNRFMTTRSGASVRQAILNRFNVRQIWDLGDTKLFEAAVLPAVLLVEGKNGHKLETPSFTSIYETSKHSQEFVANSIAALACQGVVETDDGRRFNVQHGKLSTSETPDGVWRIATRAVDTWLGTVKAHTWRSFCHIGKIRVGVKTCADKIFIRSDWQEMPKVEQPELLKPLATHHLARRFRPLTYKPPMKILYPHESVQGERRAIDLAHYPRSKAYLERHRHELEGRKYVIEAGRDWYEIWVPQDPNAWDHTKLVFPDIAQKPTFWIDQEGSVVNGDCYWLISQNPAQEDLLWLAAAVGNSTFIERFYDYRFHNKLYAGRRRFITQYVEQFPLPDPHTALGKKIISTAKQIYHSTPSPAADKLQQKLDRMVWKAFGLIFEEVSR